MHLHLSVISSKSRKTQPSNPLTKIFQWENNHYGCSPIFISILLFRKKKEAVTLIPVHSTNAKHRRSVRWGNFPLGRR